ncbi:MAG: hypothetical protein ACRCVG_01480 [Methanobacteriaceae archaeon]
MKDVFERHRGTIVGINCVDPVGTDLLELFVVHDDYFGLLNSANGFRAYYHYGSVLGVFELKNGFKEEDITYSLSINVNHFVLYNGSRGVGLGLGFPIGF